VSARLGRTRAATGVASRSHSRDTRAVRRSREQEPRLVDDLVSRLQAYRTDGAMCRHCRSWVSHDTAKAAGWWHDGRDLYCPDCAAELELERQPPGASAPGAQPMAG